MDTSSECSHLLILYELPDTSSQPRELWDDIHIAAFISHLDLLPYDTHTHTKLHCLLSAWWSKRFLPNLFAGSEILLDGFCQTSRLHLQRSRTSILPKASYAALWNPASAERHLKMRPGGAWLSLTGITGRHLPSAVRCVVLVPNRMAEQSPVC